MPLARMGRSSAGRYLAGSITLMLEPRDPDDFCRPTGGATLLASAAGDLRVLTRRRCSLNFRLLKVSLTFYNLLRDG